MSQTAIIPRQEQWSENGESSGTLAEKILLKRYEGRLIECRGCDQLFPLWCVKVPAEQGTFLSLPLQKDDYLTVTSPDGAVLFDGVINLEFTIGRQPPSHPQIHGQPDSYGFWTHWTQQGWQPEDWATLFTTAQNHGTVVRIG